MSFSETCPDCGTHCDVERCFGSFILHENSYVVLFTPHELKMINDVLDTYVDSSECPSGPSIGLRSIMTKHGEQANWSRSEEMVGVRLSPHYLGNLICILCEADDPLIASMDGLIAGLVQLFVGHTLKEFENVPMETEDPLLNLAIRAYRVYTGNTSTRVCERASSIEMGERWDTWWIVLCDKDNNPLASIFVDGDWPTLF